MKKLIEGIVKFRRDVLPGYRDTFARLALGQSPDALFVVCSDSRVAVNVFASTDPGDLFVVRNVGNLIPPCQPQETDQDDGSEAAAIEFALNSLNVSNIIVCGHSECAAMQALIADRQTLDAPHLRKWLRHGDDSLTALRNDALSTEGIERHNRLSQLNVLTQIEHLKTYPVVRERVKAGKLVFHAWWFELSCADVYAYEESVGQFVLIDEPEAARILERLKSLPEPVQRPFIRQKITSSKSR